MQSNNQERNTESAGTGKCDDCGKGFSPDERMNFGTQTKDELIESVYGALTDMQDRLHTAECIISKIRTMKGDDDSAGTTQTC